MRMSLPAFRSRLYSVAAITALCGIAASCSSVLGDRSLFTGATKNQQEILSTSGADRPLPAPTTSVTRADLPPPAGSVAMTAAPAAYPAGTASTGDNFAWSAVGGKVITVAPGETLDVLATKFGVPQSQILSSNQLASASQVSPGRVLVIPHLVGIAPGQQVPQTTTVALATPAGAPLAAKPQAGGGTYTVLTGDTLYSISQKTGTTADTLIALNNLAGQSQLRTGQVLKLPGAAPSSGTTVAGAVPKPVLAPTQVASNGTLPKTSTTTTAEITLKPPAIPAVATGSQIPATQASLSPPKAAIAPEDGPSANGTTFRWPVRGRIIASFGSSPAGQRNDGINLAVPEGTSVKAAEAGTVIYAGNELEGYGNLILVRHADGWVSAYAHNKDLAVKRGDTVARGQIIAHAGMTGSVSAPQVHFELRQGSKPVNPLDFLSG
jgi:murein DD-endopeptidase MepM/ murein hydrolase activator NlpD